MKKIFILALTSFTLLFFTFPLILAVLTALGLILFFEKKIKDAGALTLISISLLIGIGLVEWLIRKQNQNVAYLDPESKYKTDLYYQPNVKEENFKADCGPFIANFTSFSNIRSICEKRVINFTTDSWGFRNRQDYHGEPYVLIGDSFTEGASSDQQYMIGEILTHKWNIPTYTAAIPTHPLGYIDIHHWVKERIKTPFKSIFVLFEGNDFFCTPEEVTQGAPAPWYLYIPTFIRERNFYRVSFGLSRRLFFWLNHFYSDEAMRVERIGGKDMAFLNWYVRVTERKEKCFFMDGSLERELNKIKNDTALMVFIPTKYRVYHSYIDAKTTLPNVQWDYVKSLGQQFNIPTINLTDALIKKSNQLLPQGEYTYWRDDSHFNQHGLGVAAEEIKKALHQ